MDFMKVFDQTVREIKREVNLKVLKVPEIEQKVLDATDDEPWGPHGSVLAEIAQATKKFSECQMIMNVLWTRLSETGKNWRFVYKTLAVLEYLVGHGSERAVDEIVEHTFQISSLTSFEYVEPSGKDVGLNVRKKAEHIVGLLNDREKIQEARNKASANREKYVGLSSTGITYKSSSASSGSSFGSDLYRGTSNTRDSSSFRDTYKDNDPYGEKDAYVKSRRSDDQEKKKSSVRVGSKKLGDAKLPSNSGSSQRVNAPSNLDDEFDDDFDPRGTSTKSATGNSNQVDLFGPSLIGDLMDVAAPVTSEMESTNGSSSEVDLFADAAFVSAPSQVDLSADTHYSQVDLFASQPAIPSVAPATMDFFSAADTALQPETTAPKPNPTNATVADPFSAVSMNSFEGSDLFGAFSSGSNSASTEAAQSSVNDISFDNLGAKPSGDSNPQTKKDAFQVKSGIWADSLTRGLIDLNISAPKKVSLVDVGVVGDLSDGQAEMAKGPPAAFYMGRAMGTGSGLGKTGFQPSQESQSQAADVDDFFSSLGSQQYQFGNSNK